MLGDLGIEVVEEHAQRRLRLPRPCVERRSRAARGSTRDPRRARLDERVAHSPLSVARPSPRRRRELALTGSGTSSTPVATTKYATATSAAPSRGCRPRSPRRRGSRQRQDARGGSRRPRYGWRGGVGRSLTRQRHQGRRTRSTAARSAAVADRSRDPLDVGRQRPVLPDAARTASGRTHAQRATPPPGSSGARNSTAWAPASSSIASTRSAFASNLQRLQAGAVPHRDVILLARARRDRVDRRRVAERLVLGDERRRDVLGNHEARVESLLPRDEERGQAVGQARVDEPLRPPLADARELRARDREAVEARSRSAGRGSCRSRRSAPPRGGRAGCRWRR